MSNQSLILIIISVMLTSLAQLLMKSGVSSAAVQEALSSKPFMTALLTIAASPSVLLGLLSFGISAAVWLLVLSRLDVSQAYPFVALGIAITVIAGQLLFGEHMSAFRACGIILIIAGVVCVAVN
jgi:multidrug transporter EmrE-like cation transporter